MERQTVIPAILWDGKQEIFVNAIDVANGSQDGALVPLLEATTVYRHLLLNDEEGKLLADPTQAALVDRGYRCLSGRLMQIEDPVKALTLLANLRLMAEA
jgi:hypothetical protein